MSNDIKQRTLQLLHAHFSHRSSQTEYTKQGVLMAERNLWQEIEQKDAIHLARLIVEMEQETK
jgi:hypothetical protein